MARAELTMSLPGSLTLDGRDELVEMVRELAHPTLTDERTLVIVWEADNEWDLRGLVDETLSQMEAQYGPYAISTDGLFEQVKR